MRDYAKTGGKRGRPAYRTPSSLGNKKKKMAEKNKWFFSKSLKNLGS